MSARKQGPAGRPKIGRMDDGWDKPLAVLLVDDAPAVRAAFTRLLQAEPGVRVVGGAPDTAGALALIEARTPDLVVLDVELAHGEHGLDLLRRIRVRHPGLAVIVLSNYGWSAIRAPFLQAGALAYFDKANQFREAVAWVRDHALA